MDSTVLPQTDQWIPTTGDDVWYVGDEWGKGNRSKATVIEVHGVDPPLFGIHEVHGTRETIATLDELDGSEELVVIDGDHPERGAEAERIFDELITAKSKDAEPAPDFIINKANGLQAQAAAQAKTLSDLEEQVGLLIGALAPIYSPPDTEAQGVPALSGNPAPLVKQCYDNNTTLGRIDAKIRAIIAGVQL